MHKSKIKSRNITIECLIYIVIYSFILILSSYIFSDYFYLDYSNYGIWAIIASIIIAILNITLKPFLVLITLPITALTLGLFYPIINFIILKMVDVLLGSHFDLNGLFIPILIAIFISIIYSFIKRNIIDLILKGR